MTHGTSYAYVAHKCRCDVCRREHARRQKRYRLDRARGVQRLVDAQPLRDHVAALTAAGMSQWDITIAAGWKSRNALADALRRSKVTPRTMQRVLAVSVPPVSRRNGYVDATASQRRLQALAVMGWPTREIAARLGNLDAQTYVYIANGRTRTIRRRTEDAIAALYDELWDQPGRSARTRTIALRKGWAPPLAWDDDTIADPDAQPHGEHWQPRKRDRAAVVEDFTEMRSAGATFANCAMRLGMTEQALERLLYRAKADGLTVPDFNKENAA